MVPSRERKKKKRSKKEKKGKLNRSRYWGGVRKTISFLAVNPGSALKMFSDRLTGLINWRIIQTLSRN